MTRTEDIKNKIPLTAALGNGLEGLAYLVHSAHEQQNDYGFFSHLCNFVVPFIRKSTRLQALRNHLTDQRNEYSRKERELQQRVINEITEACNTLKQRLKRLRVKDQKLLMTQLDQISDILKTGGLDLGIPFYQIAFDRLWQFCQSLASQNHSKLLEGIAIIGDLDNTSATTEKPQQIKRPYLESVQFTISLNQLREHQKVMSWERTDEPWVVWEYLCIAEQCWHLPQDYFERPGQHMSSPEEVQKSNYLFNLRSYWYKMQCIRKQIGCEHQIVGFTRKRYGSYLEYITSAIVYWHSLREEPYADTPFKPFYSAELKLSGNELHLQIEEQEEGALATYLVHACQDDSSPIIFFRNLLENVGHRVTVPDTSPGSQTAPKLLNALKINGPLRKLFFEKGETYSTILKHKKAIIQECLNVDSKKLHEQIQNFKLLSGALSLINYERLDK